MWQGTYKNKDSEFTNKQLVIVKDNTEQDCVGQMIQSPENCLNGYWDRIVPLDRVELSVVYSSIPI
jgi:predicted metalloprotease